MIEVLKSFSHSRKAIVLVVAIIGVVILNILGKLDIQGALDFIKWIVGVWMASVAAEDAATKLAKKDST